MCGPSGSGKSTWATRYTLSHFKTKVVSTDQIRELLFGDAGVQAEPGKVFKIAHAYIKDYLNAGYNVIFDAMNLHPKDRRAIIAEYKELYPKLVCICVVAQTSLDECKKRQYQRERKVPAHVIDKQFNQFQLPKLEEGWDVISTTGYYLV